MLLSSAPKRPAIWPVALIGSLLATPVLCDVLISEHVAFEPWMDLGSVAALVISGGFGMLVLRRSRRADAKLERSQAQLRTVIETAFDGVVVTDGEGRILSMNRAAESMFGYESSEVVERHFGVLMTEAGLAAHEAHLARRSAGSERRGASLGQSEGRRKCGDAFPLELSLTAWTDGGHARFTGIMRDVTQQREAEAALRRSAAVHRSIVESAGEAVIVIDQTAIIRLFNPAAEAMFGYAAAEVVGGSLERLMPDKAAEAHAAYLAQHGVTAIALSGQQSTHKGRRKNGEVFAFAMNMTEWSDEGARMFTGLIRDLTESQAAEAALRRSEAQNQAIIDSAGDGIMLFDGEGRIVSFNGAAEAIFGYSTEEAVGRRVGLLMTEEQRRDKSYIARYAPGSEPGVFPVQRVERRRKNGEVFPLELTVTEWRDGARSFYTAVMRDISDRERGEAALRESDAFAHSILDSSSDCIKVLDLQGRLLYVNGPGLKLLEVDDLQVLQGATWADLWPEDSAPKVRAALREALGGERAQFSACRPGKDGSPNWWDVVVTPIPGLDGAPARLLAVSRDTTERSRAEAMLRESEERYARIFAHSLDPITLFDVLPDGRFVYNAFNPAAEQLTGLRSADMVGRTPEEVLRPKVAERTTATLRRSFAEGEPIEVEGDLRRLDGTIANLTHQLIPIRDGHGRITQMLAKSRDITESKRGAAVLRESQERFERLFQHSADALLVVLVGPNEEITYERVNRAAEALLGRSNDQVAGLRPCDVLPPEIANAASARHLETARTGAVLRVQDQFVIGGAPRSFQCQFVPIPDVQGQATRVMVSLHEITDRLVAEERLRGSQKLEAIGQLAGGVAHDFNNLLLIVDGYARRVARLTGHEGEAGVAAAEIVKAAERGTELVKQLLVFSRRQINESRPLRIVPALRENEGLLAPLLGAAHPVRFWTDEEAAEVTVEIDPAELAQAIMNLATNARDAMPGGGTVQIDLEAVELDAHSADQYGLQAGRYVEISVQDTGVGMPPDVAARIFEPFFTTKEQGKGTGLGLAMVYGFAQQSGGAVTVASTFGSGTAVRLLLPVSDRQPVVDMAEIDSGTLGGGETVLLVEDDAPLLALLRQTVEELGYRVITAQNGADALEAEAEHEGPIDLVLTDVIMPTLGGFEMAEILRGARPEAKLLFMSGYPARGENKVVAIPPGAAFLPKPFTPAKLAQAIRSALTGDPAILSQAEAA